MVFMKMENSFHFLDFRKSNKHLWNNTTNYLLRCLQWKNDFNFEIRFTVRKGVFPLRNLYALYFLVQYDSLVTSRRILQKNRNKIKDLNETLHQVPLRNVDIRVTLPKTLFFFFKFFMENNTITFYESLT